MIDTFKYLQKTDFPAIHRDGLETLQVNLGYLCNQQCLHCHVDAGPRRTEIMRQENIDVVIEFLDKRNIKILDLTGGAPEMNPHFRDLVKSARAMNVRVLDRCNLTILGEENFEWLADFLAEYSVEVVASMPCYLQENVDRQRGKGVFTKSITGLKKLNALGYGKPDELKLNLVFNPQGPSLPPSQGDLETDYKKIFFEKFGIVFNQLHVLTNMPIKRFGSMLISKGKFDSYMQLLKSSYKDENLGSVMCKTLLSVDWLGYVYDCDFNQMLGLRSEINDGRTHLKDLMDYDFSDRNIAVMDHCYGCTAGQGSSCGGAL